MLDASPEEGGGGGESGGGNATSQRSSESEEQPDNKPESSGDFFILCQMVSIVGISLLKAIWTPKNDDMYLISQKAEQISLRRGFRHQGPVLCPACIQSQ